MSMFSAAIIDPISIINCYKSCTIRKNYKTEQKTMSVTFIQFNHTHAIIVENKQSCVSAHGEHIPSHWHSVNDSRLLRLQDKVI